MKKHKKPIFLKPIKVYSVNDWDFALKHGFKISVTIIWITWNFMIESNCIHSSVTVNFKQKSKNALSQDFVISRWYPAQAPELTL